MNLISRMLSRLTLERIIAILLIIVLAVAILPIMSAATAATSTAESCYAGSDNTIPSQITSVKEIGSWSNGDTRITLYELEIYTPRPCLEKLIEIEEPYYDFLRTELGKIGEMIVQERIEYLRSLVENWEPTGEVTGISMSSIQ